MIARALSALALALAALAVAGCQGPSSDASAATAAPARSTAPAGSGAARKPKAPDEKLSAADCDAILQHMIDVTWNEELATDPDLKKASPAEREVLRKAMRAEALKDPDMKKIAKDCRTELRGKGYECILKAKTSKAIDACM